MAKHVASTLGPVSCSANSNNTDHRAFSALWKCSWLQGGSLKIHVKNSWCWTAPSPFKSTCSKISLLCDGPSAGPPHDKNSSKTSLLHLPEDPAHALNAASAASWSPSSGRCRVLGQVQQR